MGGIFSEEAVCWADGGQSEDSGFFESYEVGGVLGKGNFGEVRLCWRRDDTQHEKDLAVKAVDKTSSAAKQHEVFQSVRDETEIMEALHHPSIVELMEVFEDDRFIYVVMEKVNGGELFQVISHVQAVIMEGDVRRVGQQVFQSLEYMHSVGIVHRDVKAQNILMAEPAKLPGRALEAATVKLIDFGLAARLQNDVCQPMPPKPPGDQQLELVCGTPAMCAPEIWALQDTAPKSWKRLYGQAYGPKVDVWSAGVVMYLALLGRLPFMDRNVAKLAGKVCDKSLYPSFQPKKGPSYKVSSSCQKFLSRTLEKFQEKRPTATEALHSAWLTGRTTRGVSLVPQEPIPHSVRGEAWSEAQAVLAERFGPPTAGATELAARAAAFEAARLEAEDC